ncbi:AgmX/PglI C-terminal domain-containing protein [Pajaroellobacter abortibovis]|uniref:TonB C-terminal domain-containing protein n=1 Tax=Pajaroellobacter abortibovis TaxID=1882918 RepID=A0A1L6MVG2_9BACT|nr:AgmX/PglI C-terminal domain-containing protein [Pajaroellobacter abortibovis]APR99522.1 hypothetical protein BCY86_01630 [Pajaroellobacter abortibovis]
MHLAGPSRSSLHTRDTLDVSSSYRFFKTKPELSREATEVSEKTAIEILVAWGTHVLEVFELSPPRPFFLGSRSKKGEVCDYFCPTERWVGIARIPLIVVASGTSHVVIFQQAKGWVEASGGSRKTFREMIEGGTASPSSDWSGAYELPIAQGMKIHMEFEGGLIFEVRGVAPGRPIGTGLFPNFDPSAYFYSSLSFLFHAGLIAALAFLLPHREMEDAGESHHDQILLMQKLLTAAATREEKKPEPADQKQQAGDQSKTSKKSGSGVTSTRTPVVTGGGGGGGSSARQSAFKEATQFGMVGLLGSTGLGATMSGAASPWATGNIPVASSGQSSSMWGGGIGEATGGGLALSGAGQGGGGLGQGIGVGGIGTVGHGAGGGAGGGPGGKIGGSHQTRTPVLRQGETQVTGRLPPETIQRVVRRNFGRFRLCYEEGLRGNSSLQGRVVVKFVIDRAGNVVTTSDGGSEIHDPGVISCMLRAFSSLSFPKPEGGIVTVTYPISFSL